MTKIINFLLTLVLFTSCEGIIREKGKVVSSFDHAALDSVKISFSDIVIYSDKNGNFEIGEFVGCVPSCPELEVLVSKKGYATKYVNLSKEAEQSKNLRNVLIELTPSSEKAILLSHSQSKSQLYVLSITTAIFSLLTLLFLLLVKLKRKGLWILFVLFGTVVIHYNYLSKDFLFDAFRPSIFFYLKYTFEPTWYRFNCPIGVISFWVDYLTSKKTVNHVPS